MLHTSTRYKYSTLVQRAELEFMVHGDIFFRLQTSIGVVEGTELVKKHPSTSEIRLNAYLVIG